MEDPMRSFFALLLLISPAAAADMETINAKQTVVLQDYNNGRHIFLLPTLRARVELSQLCYEIRDNPLRLNKCEKEAEAVREKWAEVVDATDFQYHISYKGLAPLVRVQRARELVNEAEKAQKEFLDEYAAD
jgi:hypothetical protein